MRNHRLTASVAACAAVATIMVLLAGSATANPIIPGIEDIDINFGTQALQWSRNGASPDSLVSLTDGVGGEATAVWMAWPGGFPLPLWYDAGTAFMYGADVHLNVIFTTRNETNSPLTVSLIGTGGNPEGPDLEIWGYYDPTGSPLPKKPNVLLWAVDLGNVSLYGYGSQRQYVLEADGVIMGGVLAEQLQLVGSRLGVMRGHIDLSWSGLPSGYDPNADYGQLGDFLGYYSAETGAAYLGVPEPATMSLLGLGTLVVGYAGARRRRRSVA